MNDTPTPKTDAIPWIPNPIFYNSDLDLVRYVRIKEVRQLERELTAVTEQRDTALKKLKNQADRICYLEGATNHATGTPLSKAIEQRDRMAEALRNCLPFITGDGCGEYFDAREALAAVEGGSK